MAWTESVSEEMREEPSGEPERAPGGPGGHGLIQAEYFSVKGPSQAALYIYDYRVPGSRPPAELRLTVLLNGTKLASCSTKDGFFLKVFVPEGTYRVTLQVARQTVVETLVRVAVGAGCGLRVLTSSSSLAFDEPEFHPE